MNSLMENREQIQEVYAEYSRIIDRVLRFVLNLVVFFLIQTKLGYMTSISKAFISLAVAVICTFLPPVCTCIVAAVLILLQLTAASLGVSLVTLIVFVLVFIFYLRFSSNQSFVLVMTVAALAIHIPVVVPVIAGLTGGMATIIPVICGVIVYCVLHSAIGFVADIKEDDGMLTILTDFAKSALQNKEMIAAIISIVLGLMLVYIIKRMSFSYSWQVAIVAGTVISGIVLIVGDAGFGNGNVVLSMVIAVIAGLLVQFMIFNVDYSRTQQVQFEDDEYYYYVKAVPKNVGSRKKSGGKRK